MSSGDNLVKKLQTIKAEHRREQILEEIADEELMIGILYLVCQSKVTSYKMLQRDIEILRKQRKVKVRKQLGGPNGSTTWIRKVIR